MGNLRIVAGLGVVGLGWLAGCGPHEPSAGSDEPVDSVTNALVPARPVAISPTGAGQSTSPTYRWNSVSTATSYDLWVNDSTGTKINTVNFSAAAVGCNPGPECAVTPAVALALGSARWWVRGVNTDGEGKWSVPLDFEVAPPSSVPPAPTLITPSGTIGTNTPTYSWNAATDAADYLLWVRDSTGAYVIQQTFSATTAGCAGGGVCSVTPATALAAGAARFWVQASNTLGSGPWSSVLKFSVGGGVGGPTLVAPTGTIVTSTPNYQWNAVSGATQYDLWVNDSTAQPKISITLTPAQANCDADSDCANMPATALANGAAGFWVRAHTAGGPGPWSAKQSFVVNAP